jgi:TonB family protein
MTASIVLHALLFLWIATQKSVAIDLPLVTEITLLTPGELAAMSAPAAPAAQAAQAATGSANRPVTRDERFERSRDADLALDPAMDKSVVDQMSARLAAMTQNERPVVTGTATTKIPASLFGTGPATVSGTGTGASPVALSRGAALGGGGALPLTRGGAGGAPAALAPAGIPSAKTASSGPAGVGDATARRTVAGASLAGPIADRPVLQSAVPDYPEWAKREAVEGSVTLYFVVRPDGAVKENVVIQKTAGFGDFDENARLAIRAWRFEPLRGGRTGEQWGTITFHYRLQRAG